MRATCIKPNSKSIYPSLKVALSLRRALKNKSGRFHANARCTCFELFDERDRRENQAQSGPRSRIFVSADRSVNQCKSSISPWCSLNEGVGASVIFETQSLGTNWAAAWHFFSKKERNFLNKIKRNLSLSPSLNWKDADFLWAFLNFLVERGRLKIAVGIRSQEDTRWKFLHTHRMFVT